MSDAAVVVGLGDLGISIARRLHEVGVAVIGIDGAEERRKMWEAESGRQAFATTAGLGETESGREALASTAELGEAEKGRDPLASTAELGALGDGSTTGSADLDLAATPAFVCVRTTDQAAAVIEDLNGGIGPDSPLYVVTTLAVDFARGLGERAAAGGPRLVETPVSGGRGGAERGELVVMTGGPAVTPDDAAFLERTLASLVLPMPRYGDATLAKLLNNALAAYNALAFGSAVELAAGAGLDLPATAELLRRGSGGSWMADAFAGLVDDLLAKDAGLIADELGPLPKIDLGDPDALQAALARARQLLGEDK